MVVHKVIVNNILLNMFNNTSCVALFLCGSEYIKDFKKELVKVYFCFKKLYI